MNMKKIFPSLMIIFLITLLTTCFMYDERVYNNPYDPDASYGIALLRGTMQIDADTSDWDAIPPLRTDNQGEQSNSGNPFLGGDDLYELKMMEDDENIYFYISTYNGTPLLTPGAQLHTGFNTENDSIQFFDLAHNYDLNIQDQISMGSYGWWSNYNFRVDNEIWDGYGIDDPAIRFAGIDQNRSSIEVGISKSLYWDLSNESIRDVYIGVWNEYYEYLYADGGMDGFDDVSEFSIVVKSPDAPAPDIYTPLMQFGQPSAALAIDGANFDAAIWNETGVWFQDLTGDDGNITEPNTDIDKVYIKQDASNVYFLVQMADPANYVSGFNLAYRFNVNRSDNIGNHYMELLHDGSTGWTSYGIDYESYGLNANGWIVNDSAGYVEFQYPKSEIWGALPSTIFNFNFEVYDSGSNLVDHVNFAGRYN